MRHVAFLFGSLATYQNFTTFDQSHANELAIMKIYSIYSLISHVLTACHQFKHPKYRANGRVIDSLKPSPCCCRLLSYRRLLDLIIILHLSVGIVVVCALRLFQSLLTTAAFFEEGVKPLQDVNGVVDEQSEPGQAKKDPRGHEDAIPVRVVFVWITIWNAHQRIVSLW